jgi:WhiB family transcriptional regulator, redox-sensing transcriptional regulator
VKAETSGRLPYARVESPAAELEARELAMARLLSRFEQQRREPWRGFANCTTADAEVFFPEVAGNREPQWARRNVQAAREICAPCQVKLECLAFALAGRDRGIWAGTTEEQREASRALPEDWRVGWLLNAARTATGQYARDESGRPRLIEWREPDGLASATA